MLLVIAFVCFAALIVACVLAPTGAPKPATAASDELSVEGRQAAMA